VACRILSFTSYRTPTLFGPRFFGPEKHLVLNSPVLGNSLSVLVPDSPILKSVDRKKYNYIPMERICGLIQAKRRIPIEEEKKFLEKAFYLLLLGHNSLKTHT